MYTIQRGSLSEYFETPHHESLSPTSAFWFAVRFRPDEVDESYQIVLSKHANGFRDEYGIVYGSDGRVHVMIQGNNDVKHWATPGIVPVASAALVYGAFDGESLLASLDGLKFSEAPADFRSNDGINYPLRIGALASEPPALFGGFGFDLVCLGIDRSPLPRGHVRALRDMTDFSQLPASLQNAVTHCWTADASGIQTIRGSQDMEHFQ